MTKFLSVFSTSLLSFTVLVAVSSNSFASSKLFSEAEKFGFTDGNVLDAGELAGLRGGLRVGALNFDFTITTKTMVDGVLQHSATITSAILEKNNAWNKLNDMKDNQKLVTEIVPSKDNFSAGNPVPVDITVASDGSGNNSSANNQSNNNQPSNGNPVNPIQTAGLLNGVDVKVDNNSFITTIQNSNDNAVIQQLNQMDVVVSNVSEAQKLNIANQIDFQAIQSIH